MTPTPQHALQQFGKALIDQHRARVIVPPQQNADGFWFGGGNLATGPDGALYLVGRYRNFGDSRTGLAAGERGLELAIFRSADRGENWEKIASFSKADLDGRPESPSRPGAEGKTLSIEGSAIRFHDRGVEVFYSTERDVAYPDHLAEYQKPGTGVWAIHHMQAADIDGLGEASRNLLLTTDHPSHLHVKDPFLWERGDELWMLFCTHPYSWASSNTGVIRRRADGSWGKPVFGAIPRGCSWDVAITRGTAVLSVPTIGAFKAGGTNLLFYDGGECLRNLDENKAGVKRPRGYSCEEIGGLMHFEGDDLAGASRLSQVQPMFISPWGTGCSRYVDVLKADGGYYATWQQSQPDRSQPLVMNFLSDAEVAAIFESKA